MLWLRVCIRENPLTLTRYRSSEFSLHGILLKYLVMTSYKIQLVQELKPHDHPLRFRFGNDVDFAKKKVIIFTKLFTEINVLITNDCLVQLVERRHHWSIYFKHEIFLPKKKKNYLHKMVYRS